jgi:Fe-S cluster assembly protein SufD
VVDGSARSIYSGYIKVSPKAHQTDAYQKSSNLLLSKRGRVDAIPNLEIKANDVKCSHGASVKKIGEEELFYCESRGIPPNECKQLLTDGFLREAYGRIERKAVFQPLLDILNPQAFENE